MARAESLLRLAPDAAFLAPVVEDDGGNRQRADDQETKL